jgi:hypothetical protein
MWMMHLNFESHQILTVQMRDEMVGSYAIGYTPLRSQTVALWVH